MSVSERNPRWRQSDGSRISAFVHVNRRFGLDIGPEDCTCDEETGEVRVKPRPIPTLPTRRTR